MLKNIYALYAIFYNNTNVSETCNNDKCKYTDYFGKGLEDFINSFKKCTSNSPNDNYCNEFNEFIKMCKENSEYAGILIYDVPTKSEAGTTGKYLLSIEEYKNKPLYIYLKNENLLNLLKTSDFLSNKKSTIAATSVVGSAIGLPSIFYYLYKFTPFGSSLRKGKGKNIVNIDKEEPNDFLYTSDPEQTPYESRNYNVAYHTFSDTEP
ncbi:Plasmodium vivax Vir protein, putative [Plasmodium vivax]|uniref:Vir protein, putative n=1 Tax=Plasmodium vivax TaxID=5855 RepID=A0A1G4E814_PLAVI|nr:Plasmodium vivax Vir protein, putative [Plasmodium vivax]